MATFTVDGTEYELVTLDSLNDFTLGDLRVLEEEGGLSLSGLSNGGVEVTTKLLLALVLLSMRKKNPDASVVDAEKVPLSVLEGFGGVVANAAVEDDGPPTQPAAAGGVQP